jgi:chromosome segregation ATPase
MKDIDRSLPVLEQTAKVAETQRMLDTREQELRSKERILADKEKEMIRLEVELKQKQKQLEDREKKMVEQKETILKELDARKMEFEQNQIEIETQKKNLVMRSHGMPKKVIDIESEVSTAPKKPVKAQKKITVDSDEDSEFIALRSKQRRRNKPEIDDILSDEQYSSNSEYL